MAAEDPLEDAEDIDDILAQLIEQEGGSPHSDLVAEIMRTALKLVRDRTGRGDLKIINTALKEMRYSLKIFRPYRHTRKVAIFGSARTKPDDPNYNHARDLAQWDQLSARVGRFVVQPATHNPRDGARERNVLIQRLSATPRNVVCFVALAEV